MPAAGFTGDDTFTYTVADAVAPMEHPPAVTRLVRRHQPDRRRLRLLPVSGAGPLRRVLRARGPGPNVSPTSGAFDVERIQSYDPAIGEFRFDGNGRAVLIRTIHLRDATGHPYSGLINSLNPTGETIEDLSGRVLATDPDGYDPEGVVAMRDGTFWVSDEYGPFVTHFDSRRRQIGRLSPLDRSCHPSWPIGSPTAVSKV